MILINFPLKFDGLLEISNDKESAENGLIMKGRILMAKKVIKIYRMSVRLFISLSAYCSSEHFLISVFLPVGHLAERMLQLALMCSNGLIDLV